MVIPVLDPMPSLGQLVFATGPGKPPAVSVRTGNTVRFGS